MTENISKTDVPESEKTLPAISNYFESGPVVSAEIAAFMFQEREKFIARHMKDGKDFGVIPGTKKPTLLKAGAEKLSYFFRLVPDFIELNAPKTEDLLREPPLIHYRYKCRLIHEETGQCRGEFVGSCSSLETKYRYRWYFKSQLPPNVEPEGLLTKTINTRNGKAKMYRMDNPDVAEQINTIDKMAQKRAYVGACLVATQTSDRFTQDVEDLGKGANIEDAEFEEVPNGKKDAPPLDASTKTALIQALSHVAIPPEYDEKVSLLLDMKNPEKVTEDDKLSLADAMRYLDEIGIMVEAYQIREYLYTHVKGDEEEAQRFAQTALGAKGDIPFSNIGIKQWRKIKAVLDKESKK